MNIGDYYWGLYRDYCRDPFPHSLLSTRELSFPRGDAIAIKVVARLHLAERSRELHEEPGNQNTII